MVNSLYLPRFFSLNKHPAKLSSTKLPSLVKEGCRRFGRWGGWLEQKIPKT